MCPDLTSPFLLHFIAHFQFRNARSTLIKAVTLSPDFSDAGHVLRPPIAGRKMTGYIPDAGIQIGAVLSLSR